MQHYRETNPTASIQQQAQQFNWINTARAYLEIYRTLYNK